MSSIRDYVAAVVAATMALQELDHLKAIENLPTPETLLERLRGRDAEFHLLTGVTRAYLRDQRISGGKNA
jgi:hypothetical protein